METKELYRDKRALRSSPYVSRIADDAKSLKLKAPDMTPNLSTADNFQDGDLIFSLQWQELVATALWTLPNELHSLQLVQSQRLQESLEGLVVVVPARHRRPIFARRAIAMLMSEDDSRRRTLRRWRRARRWLQQFVESGG